MQLESMARELGALLKEKEQTVAVSESSAGGLVSAALLAQVGASKYFMGGGVIYTGPVCKVFLDLPTRLPAAVRSSSEPYAALAAETIGAKLRATWGLCETGAGPGGNSAATRQAIPASPSPDRSPRRQHSRRPSQQEKHVVVRASGTG